jgi:hypothetical protein
MPGNRARAHQDLRHSQHGFGPETADKDLRVSKNDGSKIRPSILSMLFKGGSVDRQLATEDMRMGRNENVKPNTRKMLFGGGTTASRDLRTGRDSGMEPDDEQMLAGGGEAFSAEDKLAAHEVMNAVKSGDAMKFLKAMKGLMLLMENDEGGDEQDSEPPQGPE